MYNNKKVVVVLPAYNAAKTLEKTINEIPRDLVDELILCDDASSDETFELAKHLKVDQVLRHDRNKGYGAKDRKSVV